MNRHFVISFSFLPLLVLAGLALLLIFGDKGGGSGATGAEKDLQLYLEIRQKLLDHFDGDLEETELRHAALQGLARATGDEYTRVNPPAQARQQDLDLQGEFFGIGVTVGENQDGSLRISSVVPGGGGAKAGLAPEDVIVAVDGASILGMSMRNSRELIRSPEEGSTVVLTILRGGDPASGTDPAATRLEISVRRERIETYSIHDVHVAERDGRRFGYVRISDFAANTGLQFRHALTDLLEQDVEGFVLDLRDNSGGGVTPAVQVVDALLAERDAVVLFTRSSRENNRRNDRVYRTTAAVAVTDLPFVVLVDDATASAAELVAGALRDHGRAYVIGTRTYGKGVVQTIFRLQTDPNYSVNITTTQYFTPLGRAVQRGANGEPGGVQPDLEVRYKDGEKSRVHARLRDRQARHNRDEVRRVSRWWDYEDRMFEVALDVLAGKPVVIR